MRKDSIAGRILAATVAFLMIALVGGSGRSAEATSYTFLIAEWHLGLTSSAQPIPCSGASDSVLGTAGNWKVIVVCNYSSVGYIYGGVSPSWTPVAERPSIEIVTGFETIYSSDNELNYFGPTDCVLLQTAGAVSGEWFQTNSRTGLK